MSRLSAGQSCRRMIALVSRAYLASDDCRLQYATRLKRDPMNRGRSFWPMPCEAGYDPTGPLARLARLNLPPLVTDRAALRDAVLQWLGHTDTPAGATLLETHLRPGRQIRHRQIAPVKGFSGRDDQLERLDAMFDGSCETVAICNSEEGSRAPRRLGGVGKTALAIEYGWRRRERYRGVWWIRAETEETMVLDLAELSAELVLGLDPAEAPRSAAWAVILEIDEGETEKPWLLIFDNMESPKVVRHWTPGPNAHVLITTRKTGWDGEAGELPVGVWRREEAVAFLLARARNADAEAADRLAEALGDLPLALSLARSYCWSRNWRFDQYLERLPDLIRRAPANAAYPEPVFATFSLAIERAAEAHPLAEQILARAAFLAPDAIPLWLLPGDDPLARDDALAALAEVSLLAFEEVPDGAEPRLAIHELVQEAMRDRLHNAAGFQRVASEIVAAAVSAYDPGETDEALAQNAELAPHAKATAPYGPANWSAHRNRIHLGDLALWLGAPSLPDYEAALAIARDLASREPGDLERQRDVRLSLNKVADARRCKVAAEAALSAYEESLGFARELASRDPGNLEFQRDVSVSLFEIANARLRQRSVDAALAAYEESLSIARDLASRNPGDLRIQRDVSVSLDKVAEIRLREGSVDAALSAYQEGLSVARDLASRKPLDLGFQRDVSDFLDRIADMRLRQGSVDAALSACEQGLRIWRDLASWDPGNLRFLREVRFSLDQVAEVRLRQGSVDAALSACEEGLEIRRDLAARDPGNHQFKRDVLQSLSGLVAIAEQTGRGDRAALVAEARVIVDRLRAADPSNVQYASDADWLAKAEARLAGASTPEANDGSAPSS